ncbi:hypothetical protein GCM10022297_06670 [Lactobacillus hamsteri]|uniref:Surface layer protein n=1 Tax=Lactobacillus hamsteri DSM 5661 = JCM 6256 TaxID=1423754 RepID=A0A0R1YEB1_9LACO|nr:SLAP domain-containing protein [Lactobacillus hamsteri]KRM40657.1 surface layer protein [Lactobacillus hamsteri DSM 5661 = JCM 6256]
MKKAKIISLTAAALLAVAPIVSTSIVSATDATQTGNTVTSNNTQTTTSETEQKISAQYTHDGKTEEIDPNNQTFQIAANSTFDPTNITLTNGDTVKISGKVSVVSNPVDTSKAGDSFTVQLSGVNNSTISYQVFVKPTGLFQLNLPQSYVTGLGDTDTVYQGQEYYITNNVRFARGEFFTGISNQSQNATNNSVKWVATKYLANSKTTTSDAETKTATMRVMHTALLYNKNGDSLGEKYNSYRQVTVNASIVTINGTKYYKLANRDAYIKATNISGVGRVLTKNAYIYATSKRRADRTVLKKGETITTYGGSYKFKNGKRYYRIEGATATNKRYVKVVNFE